MRHRALTVAVAVAVSALVLPAGLAGAAPDDGTPRAGSLPPALGAPQADRDRDHVSDDFEATLRSAGPDKRLAVIVTGFGPERAGRAVGTFRLKHDLPIVDGFAATMTAAQARALLRVPGLRRIESDGVVHALDDATDTDFGAAATRLDHPDLDGSGVGICVVDTGVDPGHEQIAPRPVTFVDYVNGRTEAYDDQGHGTHVASIAAGDGTGGASAATFRGVAPAADLYAAKVLDSSGYGVDSDIVAAVQWCAGRGDAVDVISMSIGGGTGDGTDASSLAIDQAVAGGDVAVIAGGNSGDEPGTINSPGLAAGAVTVGAASDHSAPANTDYRDDGIWLAAFSSRGPVRRPDGSYRTEPEITAPGVTVRAAQANTVGGYVTHSGTSMATPYVAGAVALALEARPAATPAEIRSALVGTAVDAGPVGADNEWGAGLIDVHAFVDTVAGTPVKPTAYPTLQHEERTVPDNGFVDIAIPVAADGVGVPLAVTMTIETGEAVGSCDIWCQIFGGGGINWSPDLDLELRSPTGSVLATSECALSGLSCGVGRQETIGIRPATAGTYVLRVFAFTGDPNYGKGGPVSVDVFKGPLGGTSVPPPEEPPEEPAPNAAPVVDAGADQTVKVNKKTKQGTFEISGSAKDSDGTVRSVEWREGSTLLASGTGSTLSTRQTRPVGTYTFTLSAADDDGAVGTDTVVVRVVR